MSWSAHSTEHGPSRYNDHMASDNLRLSVISFALLGVVLATGAGAQSVQVRRIPTGGMQPQACVDARGAVHLIYLIGDPTHSDIEYVQSSDGGRTWSIPIRVNSQRGAALAIGTVRGAHLAIGRNGRVHVAWMGSKSAEPKGPAGTTPMLYARLADDGKSFTSQRNVITAHPGVDGGGSVAADTSGNVFVAWHAPAVAKGTEQDRRVWVARSIDDGATFAPEVAISDPAAGACGCCGMRVFTNGEKFFALYRAAAEQVNRGMHLVETGLDLGNPRDREIDPMKFGACIMSTSAFGSSTNSSLIAWETNGQVFWSRVDANTPPHPAPGTGDHRKHPALASGPEGKVLLAWTEHTSWNRGGSVAWQIFDRSGKPLAGTAGHRDDLPAWDLPAACCTKAGEFVVLY